MPPLLPRLRVGPAVSRPSSRESLVTSAPTPAWTSQAPCRSRAKPSIASSDALLSLLVARPELPLPLPLQASCLRLRERSAAVSTIFSQHSTVLMPLPLPQQSRQSRHPTRPKQCSFLRRTRKAAPTCLLLSSQQPLQTHRPTKTQSLPPFPSPFPPALLQQPPQWHHRCARTSLLWPAA